MNPSLFFIFFSPSHLEGNNDGNHDPGAHICAWGGEFCQVSIFAKLVCQIVGGQFSLFCQNYMNAKLVCQTVRVALSFQVVEGHKQNFVSLKIHDVS
jgi:hypothetical protein